MSDDQFPRGEDAFLRSSLHRDQRLPTAEEVLAFQERYGLSHVPLDIMRREIVQVGIFYFCHENPPTDKAKALRYTDIIGKTRALLQSLEMCGADEMLKVEPPDLRKMLAQMRENVEWELAAIQPSETGKKQRKKTRKGIELLIVALADYLKTFCEVVPKSVYTQDPSTSHYSGEFFALVDDVCAMSGISIANQTLGDHIKRLYADRIFSFDAGRD